MNKPEEELELHLQPRAAETLSITIPTDTLESLKKVANSGIRLFVETRHGASLHCVLFYPKPQMH